jgi:hypothetical protein
VRLHVSLLHDRNFVDRDRREHHIFKSLLVLVPGLEARLMSESTSEEDIRYIADLVSWPPTLHRHSLTSAQLQKGCNSARSDDTKGLKSAVIDWITPRDQPLIPPLARNSKEDRGFNHEATGSLLCPAGLNWSDPE